MFNFVLAAQADRQAQILKIMTVFPQQRYNCNPTYEQFARFIADLESTTFYIVDTPEREYQGLEALYILFAQDKIPADIDAKIRAASASWRPFGTIVESEQTRSIQE